MRAIRRLGVGKMALGLVLGLLALDSVPPLCRAQSGDVTTRIEVVLDVWDLDTSQLDEPFASALRAASTATLSVHYPPFAWAASYEDPQGLWADYWTFRPSAMGYALEVGSTRWEGVNADLPYDPSHIWSRVTFGSFASAGGSVAFRVAVGDELMRLQLRSEELPGAPPVFNLPFLPDQNFPAFAEDLTEQYPLRLVVEIQGLGSESVLFTGSAFAHGESVLGVTVEPGRGVSVDSSSWGRIKALYH